jgi:GNAT superfamily N-acetyltransferase
MEDDDHHSQADPSVVQTWIRGWSLARETPPPVAEADGWRVNVGWPQQQVRYVFSRCSKRLQSLAETIVEPWIFLKVCAAPEVVQTLLPPRWLVQPLGFMMVHTARDCKQDVSLPNAYALNLTEAPTVTVARVLTANGEIASIGRIVFVDDFAIYDRIETHKDHRRRGLASALMNRLQSVALARAKTRGVLVATADGRVLYETLGWRLHSLYTTAVIPGLTRPGSESTHGMFGCPSVVAAEGYARSRGAFATGCHWVKSAIAESFRHYDCPTLCLVNRRQQKAPAPRAPRRV